MSSQVVLYDLPSQQGTSWSLNPWKTRLILNFKGIDYKTEWVEYPELAPKFKSFGIPPHKESSPEYTSPAIQYDDGTFAMESWVIAQELEKRYPSPSLHLDDPIVVKIRDMIPSLLVGPIAAYTMPQVPSILNESSANYFHETRKVRFGMPLPELAKTASEEGWEKVTVAAKEAGDLLRKNGGPFFLGETVSYADFILVGMLRFYERLDGEGKVFKRYMALDEAFPKVYAVSSKWLEKDD